MSNVIEARDSMIEDMYNLSPGSDELLKQAQAIKIMSDIDREDQKLEFDKIERANAQANASADAQLKKIDLAINLIDTILNPGSKLMGIFMNNRVRIKRDIMGYTFEETGVIGSHTFNNAQKDKYDL